MFRYKGDLLDCSILQQFCKNALLDIAQFFPSISYAFESLFGKASGRYQQDVAYIDKHGNNVALSMCISWSNIGNGKGA